MTSAVNMEAERLVALQAKRFKAARAWNQCRQVEQEAYANMQAADLEYQKAGGLKRLLELDLAKNSEK